MDKVFFDEPNIDRINNFLRRLKKIKVDDGNPQLSVYEELEKDGLKKRDMGRKKSILPTKDNSSKWGTLTRDGTVRMVRNDRQDFTFFTKGDIPSEVLIKLYIPIDKKHLAKGTTLLFDYIKKLGIDHESKVADDIRDDNVVVRLRKKDVKYAIDIINFVTNNSYIKKGLNKTNPFVPTIKGIGYLEEVGIGYSYNTALQKYIDNYIYWCWAREIEADAYGLLEFLKREEQQCPKDVINTYERFIRGNSYVSLVSNEELEIRIHNLFTMYGMKAINTMTDLVDNNDKIFYLESLLSNYYNRRIFYNNKKDLVRQYIYMKYANDLANNIIFVCRTSLEKYGIEHLIFAIKKYIVENNAESFSSFNPSNLNFNCREYMNRLDAEALVYIMRYTLIENGINANSMNVSDLVGSYASLVDSLKKGYRI